MRERAALLGGALAIESAPGSGTRIDVSVPLPNGREGPEDEEGEA
jgi:nitrate/nitrite-specific signal transduction histidine kinase